VHLFSSRLPGCALTYFIFTYPAVRLSRFTITTYPAVLLFFYALRKNGAAGVRAKKEGTSVGRVVVRCQRQVKLMEAAVSFGGDSKL